MPLEWQRVVVCKEMIHILDPDELLTSTAADMRSLIERIAMPLDLQLGYNGHEVGDRLAEFQALAILLPKAARAILMPAFKSGNLSAQEIAQHAEIPVRYVDFIMSDEWDRRYRLLTEFYDQSARRSAMDC